ncbi:MAG: LLM class flavin-dependent oxidoreductase [Actinomycetota bacterium]
MRIGLALPHYDFSAPDGSPVTWERLAAWARRAEAGGFDSVWISDHFFLSLARYGGSGLAFGSAEPITTLAALAAVTERVRLGTLVLSAGFRHPALVAKAATTIDLLSSGRLDLGVGAGWYEEEYRAFGYPFGTVGDRFEILEESVEVLARLLGGGDPVTWEGRWFRLEGAYCRPEPAQRPRPPLWVGGKGGPRLLRLAARLADGWNTVWSWTPEDYGERVGTLREVCERVGRDPATMRLSVGLYMLVGEDRRDLEARYAALRGWHPGGGLDPLDVWTRGALAGTPEMVLDRLAAFAGLGVEEVIVSAASVPFAVYDDEIVDLFAESVIPAARTL